MSKKLKCHVCGGGVTSTQPNGKIRYHMDTDGKLTVTEALCASCLMLSVRTGHGVTMGNLELLKVLSDIRKTKATIQYYIDERKQRANDVKAVVNGGKRKHVSQHVPNKTLIIKAATRLLEDIREVKGRILALMDSGVL